MIRGGEAPTLVLTSQSSNRVAGYEFRYIFASLGEQFEVLKEIVNQYGVHVKRLNKGGPMYLVTWDGTLGRFLFEELLRTRDYDFALPQVILRLEGHRLLNASNCFPARYDEQIAETRKKLTAQDVTRFLNAPAAKANVNTKIAILRRILNYLYSGREQQAWQTLHEMWPAADQERIKKALLKAYRTGILTQTDGPAQCDNKQ
jgi:hypothetical protein